ELLRELQRLAAADGAVAGEVRALRKESRGLSARLGQLRAQLQHEAGPGAGPGADLGAEPAAALALLDQTARPIDLGEVNGKLFLNMATGGFGSKVTANTSEDLKKVLGGAAYLLTGLTRFSEVHAAQGRFSAPDFQWEGEFLALGIGNGRQAGGGHVLCPQARVDDGLLDVSILPTPQDMVGTLGTLLGGGNGVESLFVRARVPWLEVEAAEGLDVNLDGEPLEGRKLRFSVSPGALRVHLPAGSPLLREPPRED
ncbi:lipid kinase YegS, partial [Pseudomonas aeruginosa]|nr:lipid kinase YegS [Pseudomonas aeruginosa]